MRMGLPPATVLAGQDMWMLMVFVLAGMFRKLKIILSVPQCRILLLRESRLFESVNHGLPPTIL
jgi:hypothetical protein